MGSASMEGAIEWPTGAAELGGSEGKFWPFWLQFICTSFTVVVVDAAAGDDDPLTALLALRAYAGGFRHSSYDCLLANAVLRYSSETMGLSSTSDLAPTACRPTLCERTPGRIRPRSHKMAPSCRLSRLRILSGNSMVTKRKG